MEHVISILKQQRSLIEQEVLLSTGEKLYEANERLKQVDKALSRFLIAPTLEELPTCTRVEVIDHDGRSYVKYGCRNVSTSLQDSNRTLKIFVN